MCVMGIETTSSLIKRVRNKNIVLFVAVAVDLVILLDLLLIPRSNAFFIVCSRIQFSLNVIKLFTFHTMMIRNRAH